MRRQAAAKAAVPAAAATTQLPGWAGPPPSSPRVAPSRTPAAMRRSSGTLAAPKAPTAGFGGAVAGGSSRLGLQGIFVDSDSIFTQQEQHIAHGGSL